MTEGPSILVPEGWVGLATSTIRANYCIPHRCNPLVCLAAGRVCGSWNITCPAPGRPTHIDSSGMLNYPTPFTVTLVERREAFEPVAHAEVIETEFLPSFPPHTRACGTRYHLANITEI